MSADSEEAIALYEAERNRAWHSWFAARGDVSPSDEHTRIFDGGFRMAWELWRAQPAPQPAEQKPASDVAALVEALNLMVTTHDEGGWPTATITIARAALAAHRKGGEA